jgi:hypothetical protein
VKLSVPVQLINEESLPKVKAGGYAMNVFSAHGLPCLVSDAEHVPRVIIGDMRKSVDGDLRLEHVEIPPGVTIRKNFRTEQNNGNFLIGRLKRVKG